LRFSIDCPISPIALVVGSPAIAGFAVAVARPSPPNLPQPIGFYSCLWESF
jgi:hypothetical protein